MVPLSTINSCWTWADTTAAIVGLDEKVYITDSEIAMALSYWEEYEKGIPVDKIESVFAKWEIVRAFSILYC